MTEKSLKAQKKISPGVYPEWVAGVEMTKRELPQLNTRGKADEAFRPETIDTRAQDQTRHGIGGGKSRLIDLAAEAKVFNF